MSRVVNTAVFVGLLYWQSKALDGESAAVLLLLLLLMMLMLMLLVLQTTCGPPIVEAWILSFDVFFVVLAD